MEQSASAQLKLQDHNQLLHNKKLQLKSLQQKCDLQNKKIKLFRKENEEIKHSLLRQAQIDTSLLLNSKQLSDANSKLETAIQDISRKLEIDLQTGEPSLQSKGSKPVALVTIQNITVTEQTQQIDLPSQGLVDDDIVQLQHFKQIKSLILGQNKISNFGVATIVTHLIQITKLQLNSNDFTADALQNIHHLQHLKVLDIRNNNLGDKCMKYLSTLGSLQQLSISKNGITDAGIRQISSLANLTYLDLTTNAITNDGIKFLLPLQKITHLYLMSNKVTEESVFTLFAEMPTMQVLDIRFNINEPTIKEMIRQRKPAKLQLFC